MMEISSRAPGKIILSGEHAVVHGSTSVAASIDLYTNVHFQIPIVSESFDGLLELKLKDLGLAFSWSIQRLREALPELGVRDSGPIIGSCTQESMKAIAALIEEHSIPEAKAGLAAGVCAFLWLYTSIRGFKPGKVTITSELPLGSGLGSSAALCVSLAGALLASSGEAKLSLNQPGWLSFGENELELANKWAFEGEKIIHGKPSGVDNTVSTFGNMIMFKSGKITCIKSSFPLRMLITNTKVGRNTKALVAGVFERAQRHPDAMTSIFNAIDSISKELAIIIQSPAEDELSITEKEENLQELMEMNQGLLQGIGVSHPSIETVIRTTLQYKLITKLTGAGGGGCVLTLLPTLLAGSVIDKVIAELESLGFQSLIASIGGKGLEVCFNK